MDLNTVVRFIIAHYRDDERDAIKFKIKKEAIFDLLAVY